MSNLVIYILIGIGSLACIVALIYTKWIKPNTFAYSNKNISTRHAYDEGIKKLNSVSKVWSYKNVYLKLREESKPVIIEKLFVTLQNVYIVSYPIEKKIAGIEIINNIPKMIYKNKHLDLPLDINLLLSNGKILQSKLKLNNLIFVIPMANKDFDYQKNNNIYFVQENNIFDEIKKIEEQPSDFNAKEFVASLESYMIKQKPKRTFMNIKFKKED